MTPSMPARLTPTPAVPWLCAAFVLCLCLPNSAAAQNEDAVAILSNGGVETARLYDLDATQTLLRVVDRGERRIVDAALGPVVVRDLKILPDESHLLADVEGRGFTITEDDGAFSYAFAPAFELPRVTSATVTAYATAAQPARVLITDSNRSLAQVVDPSTDEVGWQRSFSIPGARASFAQAVALPESRIAIAINWPGVMLSGIDIFSARGGAPDQQVRRLASSDDPSNPPQTVVVPDLAEIRDVMGLADGNLLVTMPFALAEIDQDGQIVWSVDITSSLDINGEFASARLLPSGRVAVATFQPGVWTTPHPNHRVHWLALADLEAGTLEPLATTPTLGAAPARVEPLAGHGGSGTFGYQPQLVPPSSGDLDALTLDPDLSLDAASYSLGDPLRATARLANTSDDAVFVPRTLIVATPGACGSTAQTEVVLFDVTDIEVAAGESYGIGSSTDLDARFFEGRWCMEVLLEGVDEVARPGTPVEFDVMAGGSDGSSVTVRDLGYWGGDAADAGGSDGGQPLDDPEPGCACSAPGGAVDASWIGLVILLLLGGLRRAPLLLPRLEALFDRAR